MRLLHFAKAYRQQHLSVASQHITAAALLLLTTCAMHLGALDVFWSGDDGFHLDNATRLWPSEYFFSPKISAEVSGNSISPWNPFTYAISIALFGLDPRGHHLHHLVVLYLSSIATYALLRRWTGCIPAIVAALLFLVGRPTVLISHELMNGHYLYGLLFGILSAHGFVSYLRTKSQKLLLASSVFFLMAMACKEIYVLLPVALAVLPESNWRRRAYGLIPFGILLILYAYWRFLAFGSFLGPRWDHTSSIASYGQLFSIYEMFYGVGTASDIAGFTTGTGVLLLSLVGWRNNRNLFVPICLALILFPLLPLAATQWLTTGNGRYGYLFWWAIGVGIGFAISQYVGSVRSVIVVSAFFIFILAARTAIQQSDSLHHAPGTQYYRFIAESVGRDILLLGENGRIWLAALLNGYKNAEHRVNPLAPQRAEVVSYPVQPVDGEPLAIRLFRRDRVDGQIHEATSPHEVKAWNDELRDAVDFLVLRPPYGVASTFASGGYVDQINLDLAGDAIEIVGWIPFSDADRTAFSVITPFPILKTKVTRSILRLDVSEVTKNPSLAHSGFSVTLTYGSRVAAQASMDLVCVVATSPLAQPTVLSNPFNRHCSKLTGQSSH